jgi:hypothetical protein
LSAFFENTEDVKGVMGHEVAAEVCVGLCPAKTLGYWAGLGGAAGKLILYGVGDVALSIVAESSCR